ncbi:MAG: bifunctional nuclease family protein [Paludibacteraceae bacterium]|nr:bifunctional nuclease family protein [Paludibacteraceae bacterium]MBN2788404.1 bifunctional nuclease family protein [Paludibacteraceae bacterium]
MSALVKLNVIGLTYSQTQSAAYALVLGEENGTRRIPIVIGSTEAQSIAMHLQGLTPTRPLTHDLFVSLLHAYTISLLRVVIFKMEKEVFYSELVFKDIDGLEVKIDSRTSDAVALAVRCQSPIFTTEEIMSATSVFFEEDASEIENEEKENEEGEDQKELMVENDFEVELDDYQSLTDKELDAQLQKAVKEEDYEKALIIRDEIKKRGEKQA